MKEFLIGVVIVIVMLGTIATVITHSHDSTCKSFGNGTRKVFSWSTSEQLNVELAKGYEIEKTYNVTNMILKKVSK